MNGKKSKDIKTPFWKRKSSSLPGSSVQQPRGRGKLSFEQFEDDTVDAWDVSSDDILKTQLEKLTQQLNTTELSKVDQIRATAQAVIEEHSKLNDKKKEDKINSKDNICKTEQQENLSESENKDKLEVDSENKNKPSSNNPLDQIPIKITLEPPASKRGAGSAPKAQQIRLPMTSPQSQRELNRLKKFKTLIDAEDIDLDELRKLSWSGIPSEVRPLTWQLLSSYLPTNKDRRELVLERKRAEYFKFVEQYFESRLTTHQQTYQQIHIDIPRTNPLIPLFQQEVVQHIFERLLFVWAVRHPASGYVQGINDLVTPYFIVFLSQHLNEEERMSVESFEVGKLPEKVIHEIEADAFWCTTHLLDGIQDNYTFAQPGVQWKVNMLRELTKKVDLELHTHMQNENLEYIQFAFRWMNNLLMREIPLSCTIRLWDTYLAEQDGFSSFHIYVCAAFLKHWRNQLLGEDFQGLMLMIQNVPTHHWADEEIKLLLAEAFRLKYTFQGAQSHLEAT